MTISSTTRKAGPFFGNDTTIDFPFTFKVFKKQDVRVTLTDPTGADQVLLLDSSYSVILNSNQDANPGGSVRYPLFGSPLPDDWRLTISGGLLNTQPTDIQNNGGFYPQVVEDMGDRSTIQIQQLQEQLDRSVKFSVSDSGEGAVLPPADLRANKMLGFDDQGRPSVLVPESGSAADVMVQLAGTSGAGMVGYAQSGVRAVSRTVQKRLRESASLLDYKLANDIDDTAALQAMVNAHQLGHFVGPEQVFVIRDAIRLRNGTRLDLRGAKIVQLQAQTPIFDARNTEGVRIYSGELEGAKSFVNSPTSQDVGVFADNAADMMLSGLRARNFGYAAFRCQVGGEEIDIRDCTVIGFADELGPTDRNNMGFCLGGTSISLQGCRVRNTAQGLIVVEKSNSVSLIGNIIKDIPIEHGMYLDTSLRNIDVIGNVLRNIGHMGIKVQWYDAGDFGSPENILISDNSIYGCGDTAIAALNSQPTSPSPLYARNVSIVDNSISEITGSAIIARYVQAMKISGNNAYSVQQRGISTDSILSGSITDNELTNIQLYGIECYGQHRAMSISRNKLREVGLTGQSNPSLAMGISVSEGRGFEIHDNRIQNELFNLTYGINVETPVSAGSSVRDNYIRGYINAGIRLPLSLLPLDYFGGNVSYGQSNVNAVNNLPTSATTWTQGTGKGGIYFGTAAPTLPTHGTWYKGDIIRAIEPDPGQPAAWICVLTGTPGTWRVLQTVAP